MAEQNVIPQSEKRFVTQEEVLSIVSSQMTDFTQTSRVQRGYFESGGFVSGSTGWRIDAAGNAEFNSGTFRGNLTASSIDIPNTTSANSFHVDSSGNVWWGATTLAAATAKILNTGAATLTFGTPLIAGSIALVKRITTDQAIPSGTDTAIIWNSEIYDTDTYHDNSTNPSRLTAPTDGKYLITGQITMQTATWSSYIRVNGSTVSNIVPILDTFRVFALPVQMTAGQYVEIFMRQNSGVDKNVLADADGNTSVSITRIGS